MYSYPVIRKQSYGTSWHGYLFIALLCLSIASTISV